MSWADPRTRTAQWGPSPDPGAQEYSAQDFEEDRSPYPEYQTEVSLTRTETTDWAGFAASTGFAPAGLPDDSQPPQALSSSALPPSQTNSANSEWRQQAFKEPHNIEAPLQTQQTNTLLGGSHFGQTYGYGHGPSAGMEQNYMSVEAPIQIPQMRSSLGGLESSQSFDHTYPPSGFSAMDENSSPAEAPLQIQQTNFTLRGPDSEQNFDHTYPASGFLGAEETYLHAEATTQMQPNRSLFGGPEFGQSYDPTPARPARSDIEGNFSAASAWPAGSDVQRKSRNTPARPISSDIERNSGNASAHASAAQRARWELLRSLVRQQEHTGSDQHHAEQPPDSDANSPPKVRQNHFQPGPPPARSSSTSMRPLMLPQMVEDRKSANASDHDTNDAHAHDSSEKSPPLPPRTQNKPSAVSHLTNPGQSGPKGLPTAVSSPPVKPPRPKTPLQNTRPPQSSAPSNISPNKPPPAPGLHPAPPSSHLSDQQSLHALQRSPRVTPTKPLAPAAASGVSGASAAASEHQTPSQQQKAAPTLASLSQSHASPPKPQLASRDILPGGGHKVPSNPPQGRLSAQGTPSARAPSPSARAAPIPAHLSKAPTPSSSGLLASDKQPQTPARKPATIQPATPTPQTAPHPTPREVQPKPSPSASAHPPQHPSNKMPQNQKLPQAHTSPPTGQAHKPTPPSATPSQQAAPPHNSNPSKVPETPNHQQGSTSTAKSATYPAAQPVLQSPSPALASHPSSSKPPNATKPQAAPHAAPPAASGEVKPAASPHPPAAAKPPTAAKLLAPHTSATAKPPAAHPPAPHLPAPSHSPAPSHPAAPSPPTARLPAAHPPAAHPPAAHPPAAKPPAAKPPAAHPPAAKPPAAHPPVAHPPVAHPPVAHPPVAHPPVAHPPVAHPPVAHPPVAHPPVVHSPVTHPSAAKPPVAHPPTARPTATHTTAPPRPAAPSKAPALSHQRAEKAIPSKPKDGPTTQALAASPKSKSQGATKPSTPKASPAHDPKAAAAHQQKQYTGVPPPVAYTSAALHPGASAGHAAQPKQRLAVQPHPAHAGPISRGIPPAAHAQPANPASQPNHSKLAQPSKTNPAQPGHPMARPHPGPHKNSPNHPPPIGKSPLPKPASSSKSKLTSHAPSHPTIPDEATHPHHSVQPTHKPSTHPNPSHPTIAKDPSVAPKSTNVSGRSLSSTAAGAVKCKNTTPIAGKNTLGHPVTPSSKRNAPTHGLKHGPIGKQQSGKIPCSHVSESRPTKKRDIELSESLPGILGQLAGGGEPDGEVDLEQEADNVVNLFLYGTALVCKAFISGIAEDDGWGHIDHFNSMDAGWDAETASQASRPPSSNLSHLDYMSQGNELD